jgi:hypothetical protein
METTAQQHRSTTTQQHNNTAAQQHNNKAKAGAARATTTHNKNSIRSTEQQATRATVQPGNRQRRQPEQQAIARQWRTATLNNGTAPHLTNKKITDGSVMAIAGYNMKQDTTRLHQQAETIATKTATTG